MGGEGHKSSDFRLQGIPFPCMVVVFNVEQENQWSHGNRGLNAIFGSSQNINVESGSRFE